VPAGRQGARGIILVLFFFVPVSGKGLDVPRLMIIGIDSAEHVVVNEPLKTGTIPHTSDLIRNGASGPFETETIS